MNRKPLKVLIALTVVSREAFLGPADLPNIPGASLCEVDVTGMDTLAWRELLLAEKPDILVTGWGTPPLSADILTVHTGLRYLCHLGGTVRDVVPRRLIETGLLVTNWGQSVGYTIAEHAVLLLLGAMRRVPRWQPYMQGIWQEGKIPPKLYMRAASLRGKRVGIHGFGVIARELVGMLAGFQVELCAYSRGVPEDFIASHGVRPCASLEELFTSVDCLVECEALSPANEGSVNEEILRLLPEGAVFINVGRGKVVDEVVLAKVAADKPLYLGLDVYADEPLPADSSLLALPQGALLSPHIAGPTADSYRGSTELAWRNLDRFVHGAPLEGVVTLEVYDRST